MGITNARLLNTESENPTEHVLFLMKEMPLGN